MEAEFWHQRWHTGRTDFHQSEANALLARYFNDAFAGKPARVFLPLCGKTRDIGWLMAQGYQVAGAELSEKAVIQLFEDLAIEPEIADLGPLKRYGADGIEIFVGDIFDLTAGVLGQVDAVYDRAALVALPDGMRRRYAAHLRQITQAAPQFLITFEYDQACMEGPPFSLPAGEISLCYGDHYGMTPMASIEVAGGLKGKCAATENLWLLQPAGSLA